MLNYRHIEIFQAVMKTGNMGAAAELLFTSQPTISREIARLEKLCGFQLFERKHAKIYPTEAALTLYDEVVKSHIGLSRIIDTVQHLQKQQLGTLQVCCLPFLASSIMPKAIARLKQQSPNAKISITPLESPYLENQLSAQHFHLGFVEDQHIPAGTSLKFEFHSHEVCILPIGHPLLAKATLSPEDFHDTDFISFAAQDPYRKKIDHVFEHANIQRNLHIETASAHAICMLVQQGLGVSIVNPLVMLDYLNTGVAWRPLNFSIPFTLNLVSCDYRPKSSLSDLFTHNLIEIFKSVEQLLLQEQLYVKLKVL